jgi:hypothetical protein
MLLSEHEGSLSQGQRAHGRCAVIGEWDMNAAARENGPDCGMGILTTVFADAGEEFYPNRFFELRKGNGP